MEGHPPLFGHGVRCLGQAVDVELAAVAVDLNAHVLVDEVHTIARHDECEEYEICRWAADMIRQRNNFKHNCSEIIRVNKA